MSERGEGAGGQKILHICSMQQQFNGMYMCTLVLMLGGNFMDLSSFFSLLKNRLSCSALVPYKRGNVLSCALFRNLTHDSRLVAGIERAASERAVIPTATVLTRKNPASAILTCPTTAPRCEGELTLLLTTRHPGKY